MVSSRDFDTCGIVYVTLKDICSTPQCVLKVFLRPYYCYLFKTRKFLVLMFCGVWFGYTIHLKDYVDNILSISYLMLIMYEF